MSELIKPNSGGTWLRGVWITADEIETAIIAACLRSENRTEARMYERIVYGDSGAIITTPQDEGALWQLLHDMATGRAKSVVTRKWSNSRYDRWFRNEFSVEWPVYK